MTKKLVQYFERIRYVGTYIFISRSGKARISDVEFVEVLRENLDITRDNSLEISSASAMSKWRIPRFGTFYAKF